MKKLIFILLLFAGIAANAQFGSAYTFPTVQGDSLTNADTVFKKITVTGGYAHMSVQVSIKKGTGTLDGKAYVYSSTNGSHYVLTDSASFSALPAFATALTGSLSGFTHTAIINKTSPPGTAYIVLATQAGSLTASPVRFSYTLRSTMSRTSTQ